MSRFFLSVLMGLLVLGQGIARGAEPGESPPPAGVLPLGADGKPLNLDFETGDLRHWLAQGDAFSDQPVKGDTVHRRRPDMYSRHAGRFWVGTYERKQDTPQGTLTSAPFTVTHPFASFLVGGGPHATTRVELVRQDTQKVFFHASGREREDMHREIVDLKEHMGKKIFIRLVDRHSGGWGHINFDDFKFYKTKPAFPTPPAPPRVVDLFKYAGLPAEQAAKVMTLPEGFHVTACASEPDVRQPIAMCLDDRGRVWIAEAYAYPVKLPKAQARDRILIFEDSDGDGKFDKRKVFTDKLNLVSGLEVGFGGVWVGQAPELLFIPDADGDDQPDGPPQVVLDGWAYQDTHETLNSFIWGPDGWLYGCHGVFTHSRVGKPGTPDDKRTPINAGIWRYHPLKKKFEVFAWGTSNPWGVDFNDKGQCFLTCCVIPHLFHVIQGARYHRQAGQHFQPYTYADIPTIARHRHWVGNQWNDADRARSDASGGGHAHAGAMVYLGGSWPEKYRGELFMNNIHGARLNLDRLTPQGSGYAGDGEPDFCKTNDLYSQIINLRYGPDGQVYMIDWYDRNQCHNRDPKKHDRSNGRIYKILYKNPSPVTDVNLAAKSDAELVQLQLNQNDWYVRHARRLLQERAAAGKLSPGVHAALEELAFTHDDVTRRLRGLWALHVTGGLTPQVIARGLKDKDPYLRGWTIQLAFEDGPPAQDVVKQLEVLARNDASPVVRLYIASALQRLPLAQRGPILAGLLDHAGDAQDHNLPLMDWYAAEPLASLDAGQALALASASKVPLVLQFMIRRIASEGTPEALELLVKELAGTKEVETQVLFLQGIQAALVGRRKVAMPRSWEGVYARLSASSNGEVRTRAKALAVTFGDPTALAQMRQLLQQEKTPLDERRGYLETLLAAGDKKLVPVLLDLLSRPPMRQEALRALASYDDPAIPKTILGLYASYTAGEKRDALMTLCSRDRFALALLDAIEAKKVPLNDVTADLVRQLRNLKDKEVVSKVGSMWVIRDTAEDKAKQIAHYKRLLQANPAREADLPQGRAVFAKTCQQCHRLFGTGGNVGPELTGANRGELDYLLSNILDPSALMGKDYLARVIETRRGRVVTGLIREETKNALTVVTGNDTIVLPRSEILEIQTSDKSMMPDDLLKPLSDEEVRVLVGYLQSRRQVPLLATPENAVHFFDGKDLLGWQGDPGSWKVEKGVLIGTANPKGDTLLINELLAEDFHLSLQVRPSANSAQPGIRFRGQVQPQGGVKGYSLDLSTGQLQEEGGRGLLASAREPVSLRANEWNRIDVTVAGSQIAASVNGKQVVQWDDPAGARAGVIALRVGAGQGEVQFKDLQLEVGKK